MKTKTILLFSAISIFLLMVGTGCEEETKLKAPAEEQSDEQMKTRQASALAWDYPVKPGTTEWSKFQNSQEMREACQIPEKILSSLSTEDLTELCLNYPLLGDMLFSNTSIQDGFDFVSSTFNGLQELFKREDAGKALLKHYEQFDLNYFEKNKGTKITNVFFDLCIDIVIGQPIFLDKLNSEERKRLIEITLKNLKMRKENMDSPFRQKTTAVILSRLLIKENSVKKYTSLFSNDNFLQLSNNYILTDKTFIDVIQEEAEYFLNNK